MALIYLQDGVSLTVMREDLQQEIEACYGGAVEHVESGIPKVREVSDCSLIILDTRDSAY